MCKSDKFEWTFSCSCTICRARFGCRCRSAACLVPEICSWRILLRFTSVYMFRRMCFSASLSFNSKSFIQHVVFRVHLRHQSENVLNRSGEFWQLHIENGFSCMNRTDCCQRNNAATSSLDLWCSDSILVCSLCVRITFPKNPRHRKREFTYECMLLINVLCCNGGRQLLVVYFVRL